MWYLIEPFNLGNRMTMVKVIACLSPGFWRVIVGPGAGMLDGGSHQDWPEDWVPLDARRPSRTFWISGIVDGKPQISEDPR